MKYRALAFLTTLFALQAFGGFKITPIFYPAAEGDLYLVTIGVDEYPGIGSFSACKSDAIALADKISTDFMNLEIDDRSADGESSEKGAVKSFTLTEENATYDRIKTVFETIAESAKPNDNFIFIFAGLTTSFSPTSAFLVPHIEDSVLSKNFKDTSSLISLELLSTWMEKINAKNQLVISEAGNGQEFAHNLILNLFEQDPLFAYGTERRRMILTTKGLGVEGKFCGSDKRTGRLANLLLDHPNILSVFDDADYFEYHLLKLEMTCPDVQSKSRYSMLYNENEYKWLLINRSLPDLMRGTSVSDLDENGIVQEDSSRTVALIIATTDYSNSRASWSDLANPLNDAQSIATTLQNRFGCDTIIMHNKSSDEVYTKLIELKKELTENDRFILFIAGHGLYDPDHGTGYLVFSDSKPINHQEKGRNRYVNYLSMSNIEIVDDFKAKNVLVILDVCFGASFDFDAPDMSITNYDAEFSDLSINELVERKSQYYSRIFIASGIASVPDFWIDSRKHSPFASKLLKAMNKEDEFLSPGKLYQYLEANVTEPVLKSFGRHEARGDFILPANDTTR